MKRRYSSSLTIRILIAILLLLPAIQLFSQEVAIGKKSIWKYDDSGRNLGTGWRQLNYNDVSWASGPGILGYGEVDTGTEISYGNDPSNKNITAYFRKSFTVTSASQYHGLFISLLRDDGAIVYLNGQLIASSNMPESYTFSTPSEESVGGDEERTYFDFVSNADFLVDGLNVIAVEVHQSDPGSSDLSFDLELKLSTQQYGALRINEICPRNVSNLLDPDNNQFQDWVEFHNPKPEPIDLGGYFFTDNINRPQKWSFPSGTVIPPNGFLVLYADGLNDGLHVNFSLSGSGEKLVLYDANLVMLDSISYPNINPDQSYGIMSDGSRGYFGKVTPGKANEGGLAIATRASAAVYSIDAGFYSGSVSLELSSPHPGAQIRYSLNGDDVDESSDLYSSPIQISSNKTVKTKVFVAGMLPSATKVQTYFINRNHDLPVFSLTTDPDFMDDSDVGIYREDNLPVRKLWDRPGVLEFFDESGSREFAINIDYRLFGRGAIYFPQKSLAIFMRMTDGYDGLNYKLFPNSPVDYFQSFVLRSSSDDWRNTMFRDGMEHSLLVDQMDLEYMDYRPSVLYINGEYYGIHNIRDKLNESYLSTHKGADPQNVDILFIDNDYAPPEVEIKSGDDLAYWAMYEFVTGGDMTDETNYAKAGELIDLDNYLNYCAVQITVGNRSWLHNRRVWRPKTIDGKFRYMLFDLDYGYIFLDQNILASLYDKDKVFRSLMKNSDFKSALIQKLALYSQTIFDKDRVKDFINEFAARIESEIPNHAEKWGPTFSGNFDNKAEWVDKVNVMKDFNDNRANVQENYIQSFLGNPGRISFSLSSSASGGGTVYCHNVKMKNGQFSGYLYEDQEVVLRVEPEPGYRFAGWSGTGLVSQLASGHDWDIEGDRVMDLEIRLKGSSDLAARANYDSPKESNLVITELFYAPDFSQGGDDAEFIEVENTGSQSINLSGYTFSNAITFTFPENSTINSGETVIIAKTPSMYQGLGIQVFDWDDGRLSDSGERLELKNSAGTIVDKIEFSNKAPWPLDVSGYSIEVCDPELENDDGSNWVKSSSYGGTPGQIQTLFCPKLVINEVVGMSNDQGYLGNKDWIEILNTGSSAYDLAGLYLTDEKNNPLKYKIPSGFPMLTTISPGGYKILIADGQPEIGPLSTNFKISGAAGYIGLFSQKSDGSFETIDELDYSSLPALKSYGRIPNGQGSFVNLTPSPGSPNSMVTYNIVAPELLKPGELLPIVIRITDENGEIDKTKGETLTISSSLGTLEPNTIDIRNGIGSATVLFSASDDFEISVSGYDYKRLVKVSNSIPSINISGTINEALNLLSGVTYKINSSITIGKNGSIVAQPGARIILGNKANVHVEGVLDFKGTLEKPVILMPTSKSVPWGGIDIADVSDTIKFKYTFFIYGAGDASKMHGHSYSQPLIRIDKVNLDMNNCFVIDNIGKGMFSEFSRIGITDCVFSRLDTGPEMEFSYTEVRNSWFTDIPDTDRSVIDDDNDGLYFEGVFSASDPPSLVDGCVIYSTEDDGIDTSAANLLVLNTWFSRNYEKGISAGWRSDITVQRSVFYKNAQGISSSFWTPVKIDHCNFINNSKAVYSVFGGGTVSNSIMIGHSTSYSQQGDNYWYFSYCLSDSDPDLLGPGNIYGKPKFVDEDNKDYRLSSDSPAIDSGDPSYKKDPDGSITDIGIVSYSSGFGTENSLIITEIHYNPLVKSGISEQAEFIEITNAGSTSLNVSSYRIDDAISFAFPANTILEPGEIVLIAFERSYYSYLENRVYQWSSGKLSNGGEIISLYSSDGRLLDQVSYGDADPWPVAADGAGYSLELINLRADNLNFNYWKASLSYGGTPGKPYQEIDFNKLKINELYLGSLDDSDLGQQEFPWLEIYNGNLNPVNLENMRFINDKDEAIVLLGNSDWIISSPNGYKVVYLDPIVLQNGNVDILNSGGNISLERFDGVDWLKIDQVSIPSISVDNSYGRFPNGEASLMEFDQRTPGLPNTTGSGSIITPRRIVSGDRVPVIVRLGDANDTPDYLINMNIGIDADGADFSRQSMQLVHGTGSMTTTVTASESYVLEINELEDTVGIQVFPMRHRFDIDKKIVFDQTWTSEHDYYIDHDLVIQAGVTLTIQNGARVFIYSKGKIIVEGRLEIHGTPSDPVLFTSAETNRPWGNIEFPRFSNGGDFNGVIFMNGGGDDGDFTSYTNSQAIIESDQTQLTFNHCFFVDNPGKAIYAVGTDITMKNSLVSETETGIIVQDGTIQVDQTWFQFIPDTDAEYTGDEHDAIFVSTSTAGGTSSITNSRFNFISDDAITAYSASWLGMRNLFFHNIGDKGATIYDSPAEISYVVISNSQTGVSVRGDSEAFLDHGTFHNNNVHLKSYSATDGSASSDLFVTNSILSEAQSADFYKDIDSGIEFSYTLSTSEQFDGPGNILASPGFQNSGIGDFRLSAGSAAVDAGDPDSPLDNDGSITDLGAFTGRELFSTQFVINEIMYAPRTGGQSAEFIEIYNAGGDEIDLSNYRITNAVEYVFPAGIKLSAGEYAIITNKASQYLGNGYQVFQWQSGDLGDSGDIINVFDSEGRLVDVVNYTAGNEWPKRSVGTDFSIELYDPGLNNSLAGNWHSSFVYGGTPGRINSEPSSDGIVLNELMARNNSVIQDDTGEYVDWVELYNTSNQFVSINGFYLTGNQDDMKQYEILGSDNDLLIAPKEYKIFWLDASTEKGLFHTNFQLAAAGGFVGLSKMNGITLETVDAVSYSNLGADIPYGRHPNGTGSWKVLNQPTPGSSNDVGSTLIAGLFINEVLARNSSVYLNDVGEYDDWIELYNQTLQPINVAGLYITDDPADPLKFKIPYGHADETTIPSRGFLMLFPSAKPENGPRHLNFQLAGGGEHVVLTQDLFGQQYIIDEVAYPALSTDYSWGRVLDAFKDWKLFEEPTPNSSNGYNSIQDVNVDEANLKIFPNPASERISIELNCDENYDYSIEVFNILSQEVRLLEQKDHQPAYNQVVKTYDVNDLAGVDNAFVIFRVRINDDIFYRKIYLNRY